MRRRAQLVAVLLVAVASFVSTSAPADAHHVNDAVAHVVVTDSGGLTPAAQNWLATLDSETLERGVEAVGGPAIRRFKLMLLNSFLPPASEAAPLRFNSVQRIEWCARPLVPGCWYFERDDSDVHDPQSDYGWEHYNLQPVPDDGTFGDGHYPDLANAEDFFYLGLNGPGVLWEQGGNPCGPDAEAFGGDLALATEQQTVYCPCLTPPKFSCPHSARGGVVWRSATEDLKLRPQTDTDAPNVEINFYRRGDWDFTVGAKLLRTENEGIRNWIARALARGRLRRAPREVCAVPRIRESGVLLRRCGERDHGQRRTQPGGACYSLKQAAERT
jgi:hypothetical protein